MIEIISFGYLHAPAPDADFTCDLRRHFRDPHLRPAFRDLTAADPAVMDTVMATPGIPRLASAIASAAAALLDGPGPAPVVIAIGCAGGRHRSAAVAVTVARLLRHAGHEVALTHRDIGKPAVRRPPGATAAVTLPAAQYAIIGRALADAETLHRCSGGPDAAEEYLKLGAELEQQGGAR